MATYDERLAGLLAIGMPRRLAMVVAFRPELAADLGNAASIAMNPTELVVTEAAARSGGTLAKKKRKRKTAYSKALSKALVNQNAKQRKKNGGYKKGKSARSVLAAAHKEARRMTKK